MTNKSTKQTARQRRHAYGGTRKARKHASRSVWRAQRKEDGK